MKVRGARAAWGPILACTVCFAVGGNPISFAPASLFVIPITGEFGWTRAQFFAGLSIATLVSAVIVPFVGRIVDRWGSRAVILPGIIAFGVVVAALSQLSGYWPQYLALMMLLGVTVMMHGPLPYSRVVVASAGAHRGLALAIAMSGSTIGLILVSPLCSQLITRFGWRIAEMTLGAIVIAVALPPALLFVGRRQIGVADAPAESMRALPPPFPWQALRAPLFWALGIVFLLNATTVHAFLGHAAAIAVAHGLSVSVGALAVSVSGMGSVVGRLLAGFMLDRIKSPQVGQVWFALAFVGLLVAAFGTGVASLIAAAALIGATLGAEVELIGYFTSRFYPPGLFGRIYGLLFTFFLVGVSLGPLAFAMLYDAAGNYQLGFFAMAAAQLLGCLILTRVGSYRYRLNGEPADAHGEAGALTGSAQTQA